ncbi:P-loop containing nucleoside triphosphate hydrolase protein [Xylaria sp. FL0043]|nr:P-loop containing nucleoside triphosphate hydrolase protein [Xylaria sp. FL0043]
MLSSLSPVVESTVASMATIRKTGKIAWEDVWQIFAPNTLVSTNCHNVWTINCVTKYKKYILEDTAYWRISLKYIDWNGESTGYTKQAIEISQYEGYRRVTSLPLFPTSFLEDEASCKEAITKRGRAFERLRGFHLMSSNGTKLSMESGKRVQQSVAGRFCVDAYAYYSSSSVPKLHLTPLSPPKSETQADNKAQDSDQEMRDCGVSDSTAVEVEKKATAKGPEKRVMNLESLTDEQCLLATPWVKAFDLKAKQWCELLVDELQEVSWNDDAFDKLVLPGDEKDLAWEFVEAKALSQSAEFDDFIPDKGRGLLILMFGPPGVGKTFTAEAVAEKSRVPLYAMSAAELGTSPCDVERALKRALDLCRMWNAMLLLDEADVFLGVRTPDSIQRNELVSIFLRMLEYYQGTMFLTTNRVASIDPAFQSRVDLFLPYYDLTNEARREIWRNFIERAGADRFEVTDASLEKLSNLPLNGREIKNLIKSARMLSLRNGQKVAMERIYMLAERRVQALSQVETSEK